MEYLYLLSKLIKYVLCAKNNLVVEHYALYVVLDRKKLDFASNVDLFLVQKLFAL